MNTASRAAPAQMTTAEWGLLLLLGAIWGGSFFFARVAVMEIHPLLLVFFRVLLAAAALNLWLAAFGPSIRAALPLAGGFLLLGFINNVVPFSLIFVGQTELGAGLASILNATTPFWTLVIANAVTDDEKLTGRRLGGILLGIGGTALMIGPGALTDLGGPIWAKLALIGAALSYAVAVLYARRFRGIAPRLVATGQLTASTVIMLPVASALFWLEGLPSASMPVWAAVVALGIVSTALAYILYFSLLATAGATNTSLVTLIVPVTAILLGALLLSERLEYFEIAGMVLIGLGLLTIDGRLRRRR